MCSSALLLQQSGLGLHFQQWRARSADLEARIDRLQRARRNKSQVRLFDAGPMPDSVKNIGRWKLISDRLQNGASPSEILNETGSLWDLVIFLNTQQRFDESLQAFEWWRRRHRAEEEDYVKFMIMASKAGKTEAVQRIFNEMDVAHSAVSFNALIQSYTTAGEMEMAEQTVKQMLDVGVKPNVATYTHLITGYGKQGLYDEMTRVFNTMKTVQCRPDFYVYKHLIRAYSSGGLVGRMENVFRDMLSDGWKADAETVNIVGRGFASMGMIDKMEQLQSHMKRKNIPPDEATVHAMALAYIRRNYFYQMGQFVQSVGVKTRGNTATLLCNILLLSSAANFSMKKLQRDFQEITDAKFNPDLTTFNIRAIAFSRMQMFWDLHVLVRHIHSVSLLPDMVTFGAVVDAYVDGRLTDKLPRALDELRLLDTVPDVRTDSLVFEAFGRGRFQVFCEEYMEQNSNVKYSTLVTCYFEMLTEKRKEQSERRRRFRQRFCDIWQ